jgi:hypothetical protein
MNALRNMLVAFLGSRLAIGIAGLLFVAFAAHSLTAPERLPPVGRLGLVELGILEPVDVLSAVDLPQFIPEDIKSDLKESARAAASSAAPKATGFISAYLEKHQEQIPAINYVVTALSFGLLLLTSWLQTATIRRRRKDVYAFVDGGFGT